MKLGMTRQEYEDFVSKYKDLAEGMKKHRPTDIIEEVPADFCLELVQKRQNRF
jgi:hypothetical protein